MFWSKKILTSLVVVAVLILPLRAKNDVWNRLVRFESQIQESDYSLSDDNDNKTQFFYKNLALQLYSNHSFVLVLDLEQPASQLILMGTADLNSNMTINNHQYILSSSQVEGTIAYQTNKGLKWTLNLKLKQKGIKMEKQELKYSKINQIALFLFGVLGLLILPLSDRIRSKMLFNIRKRTHVSMSYIILVKMALLLSCFLMNSYYYVLNSPWYHLFWIYGLYLFMISPSIIHSMYFITSIQRQVKEMEWFKLKGTTAKCLTMSFIILSIPILVFALVFVPKGVFFYFLFSTVTIYQHIQACRTKRYGFGKVTLYDLLLTAILSLLSSFVPSLNFTLLTLKQQILFWNYYLAVFIFGIVLTRIIIKIQIAQEIHLQENNESVPGPVHSQIDQEMPKIYSNEILQD